MTAPGPFLMRSVLLAAARFVIAAAIFGVAELFAGQVLGSGRMPLALVLIATGLVAVVFWSTRAGLEHLVDRLLFGERAAGFEAGRALLQRMATTLPVDDILPALAETAGRTTHSARAEVRVLLSDGRPWSQVWPVQAVADGSPPLMIGVRHAGTEIGEIEVDPTDSQESGRDRMLLDELARPAGLALNTVRLTVELRRRATDLRDLNEQLERSNSRIVQARRDEIDRLRGEMHQRVSPHIDRADAMVHDEITVLTADVADGGPPPGEGASRSDAGRLDVALTEVAEALESLRTLARGIYPPRLADAGLEVSLEGWQQRSGVALDFRLIGDDAALRRHSDIESCLYFSLVTVLAALSGESGHPAVVVEVSPGYVDAVISGLHDGGGGGDDDDAGAVHAAALRAVRDRVEAFDGQLTIEAPPQATASTVRLRLPLSGAQDAATAAPKVAP